MKYHNKKTEYKGMMFDSQKEAEHYVILEVLENVGAISNLRRQVKYELIPKLKWSTGKTYRATYYIADFVYERDGKTIVEDVKGFRTPVYKLKRLLMKWLHNIEISEV